MLDKIKIIGYKSIAECDIYLTGINILIGANGAGKSNFIGLFKLVQQMLQSNLQLTIRKMGGVDSLLHFGRKKTESLQAEFYFGYNGYKFTLEPTVDNLMMFSRECTYWNQNGDTCYGSGHLEAKLPIEKISGKVHDYVMNGMQNLQVYHFHDTSDTARVKGLSAMNDYEYLRHDASNLATYLMYLRDMYTDNFQQIENIIRLVAPFFGTFFLRPDIQNPEKTQLEWFEKGEDIPFKAHHLSDGTLRFICLATLLLQPTEKQPDIIIIDEPELGLHPYAITVLAGLIKSVYAQGKQVIISTQSVDLLSEFSPHNIIVVNRDGNQSVLSRLQPAELTEWLNDYSLGELWKKNILGGRPA